MITRRAFVLVAGIAAVRLAGAQPARITAARRREALEAAIREVADGQPLREGGVKIEIAPLIDNGNTVPVAVTVDSPMTAADHVRSIHLFTEMNPQPLIAEGFLGPRAGRAWFATRARIADTGQVVALARLANGEVRIARVEVIVTLPACAEESIL